MANIESIDFSLKRINLHLDTVASGFDTMQAYFEVNSLILNTPAYQGYNPPLYAEGNIPKESGKATPRYVLMESGWLFVPYNGVAHTLRILVEPVSKDNLSGVSVFDRSNITNNIDLIESYEKIEIRYISTGSGVLPQDVTDIANAVNSTLLDDFSNISVTATVDTAAIALAVEAQLANEFSSISASVDVNAIALAVEAILLDDFSGITVDSNAIATAVKSKLSTELALVTTDLVSLNDISAAIKVKTDQLIFTKTNELDVNIKSQNEAKVNGTGIDGDRWRGTA